MGFTDRSLVQEDLDKLNVLGEGCREEWPKDFNLSQAPRNAKFTVQVACKKGKGAVLLYQVDAAVGARCRDIRALALKAN